VVGTAPIRGCAGERIRVLDGVQGQSFVCVVSISGVANDQDTPRGDDPVRTHESAPDGS